MAHKKGLGSSRNGRDSESKRLGVKVFAGRPWFAAEPPGPFLRLTYAAAPPELLDEAVRRLAVSL